MSSERSIVLDCRWLGIGGPGRTIELVLRGLAQTGTGRKWLLWGSESATEAMAWPGCVVRPIAADPRLLLGQRHAFAIPRGDFYVFMHQQRPLRNLPSMTLIYDTIALRYGANRTSRHLKRLFLRRMAGSSRRILTISEYSKAAIVHDLNVPAECVDIIRFPFDAEFVDRVRMRRKTATPSQSALFIGGFLPHKNIPRLLRAFRATEFCRGGGQLVLVGGTPGQAADLTESMDSRERSFVSVRHSCTQTEIEDLYATSLFLVQPSLEEGFGLPAWEAMCCGVPVCVSDGGSLPELTRGFAEPFPATSTVAMTAGIDATAVAAQSLTEGDRERQIALLSDTSPTIEKFGAQFEAFVMTASTLSRCPSE